MKTRKLPKAYRAIRAKADSLGMPIHYRRDLHHHDRLAIESAPDWDKRYGSIATRGGPRESCGVFLWGVRPCGTSLIRQMDKITPDDLGLIRAHTAFESQTWFLWTGRTLRRIGTPADLMDWAKKRVRY